MGKNNMNGIKRLDAITLHKAVEIDKVGQISSLREVIRRLKSSDKSQKVLIVPAQSMDKAKKMLKEAKVSATIRNLSGTKREYVSTIASSLKAKYQS